MSESTSLREAIARAARGALDAYYAQPNDDMQLAEEDVITDAVLAVLADHDAKVRAEALREAADDLNSNFQDLPGWDKAYRNGARTREWEHGAITIGGDVIRKLRDRADRIERGDFL